MEKKKDREIVDTKTSSYFSNTLINEIAENRSIDFYISIGSVKIGLNDYNIPIEYIKKKDPYELICDLYESIKQSIYEKNNLIDIVSSHLNIDNKSSLPEECINEAAYKKIAITAAHYSIKTEVGIYDNKQPTTNYFKWKGTLNSHFLISSLVKDLMYKINKQIGK